MEQNKSFFSNQNFHTTYIQDKVYNEKDSTRIAYYARKDQTKYADLQQSQYQPRKTPFKAEGIMRFRPCENINNFINKKKIAYIEDGVIYKGSERNSEEKICSEEAMYEGVHILTIKLDVPIDLMRKKEDHFTKNVPINNTFLRLPTFKAGLIKDGEEDKDLWKENYCFKRIFGNLGEDNKGIITYIKEEKQWEYKYDFSTDLTWGKSNAIQLKLDLNDGSFKIIALNSENNNEHVLMKNFLKLNGQGWRFYFAWSYCKSELEILEYQHKAF